MSVLVVATVPGDSVPDRVTIAPDGLIWATWFVPPGPHPFPAGHAALSLESVRDDASVWTGHLEENTRG